MANYKVKEAVWLAAAIMAYDAYHSTDEPDQAMMYFRQVDIQKKAQEMCDQNVASARISEWYNADYENRTYNYLRTGEGSSRRLVFTGEFNGEREIPNLQPDEIVETVSGEKTVGEIIDFVKKEYTELFSNSDRDLLLTKTKCISVLDFLDTYANREYKSPDKETDPIKKEEILQIKEAGSAAIKELEKMARLCEMDFGLKMVAPSRWLTGGNDRVRAYQWVQLKKTGKQEFSTSISIFAEKYKNEKARFRFSVELNDAHSEQADYDRHHRFLEKDIAEATSPLVYVVGGNSSETAMRQLNLSTPEIKKRIESGEIKKIQISQIWTREDIDLKLHQDFGIINAMEEAISALIPYYDLAVGEGITNIPAVPPSNSLKGGTKMEKLSIDKNTILYGPPGTGKTYNTVIYAVAIIEEKTINEVESEDYKEVLKRYNEYKVADKITFTTFHQSYGYEEFIEGIKPQLSVDDEAESKLEYSIEPGMFKKFCQTAQQKKVVYSMNDIRTNPTIWKVSLQGAKSNPTKTDCFQNDRIRIGWPGRDQFITDQSETSNSKEKKILTDFQDEMQIGDLVLSLYDKENIDAIGVITGDYEWLENGGDYPRSRNVKWLVKNIQENIVRMNGSKILTLSTVYRLSNMSVDDVISIVKKYTPSSDIDVEDNKGNYVFIIDEINRGNISKIFGELITLIETTKRMGEEEAVTVKLPYSDEPFGVPNNVYILGTMNTADRSIALMDTALRRRFKFVEMMPKAEVLVDIPHIEGIDIEEMFNAINQRIEFLFDREHTIGHAYFLPLKKEPTLTRLADIFKNAIIPLLQEYFYEDYSKIQLVLADNVKEPELKFIRNEKLEIRKVFKGNVDVDLPEEKYSIQKSAFLKAQSYIQIY